jgi:hypothetical protein
MEREDSQVEDEAKGSEGDITLISYGRSAIKVKMIGLGWGSNSVSFHIELPTLAQ